MPPLDPIVDAICDVFGEATSGMFRKILEEIGAVGRNDLAATFGLILGIYSDGKMPRRYKCLDFVKIFGLTKGFDEEYIYGEPSEEARSIREMKILPKFYDLIGGAFPSMHALVPSIEKAEHVARAILRSRAADKRLKKFSIVKERDKVSVTLCYEDPSISKALNLGKAVGGFFTGILVESLAMMMGYEYTKPIEERVEDSCITFTFKMYR